MDHFVHETAQQRISRRWSARLTYVLWFNLSLSGRSLRQWFWMIWGQIPIVAFAIGGFVVKIQWLPLVLVSILTVLRDISLPVEHSAVAKLLAPSIAWAILFFATCLFIPFCFWRQQGVRQLLVESRKWIEMDEINVAICFSLAHISSAAANDVGGSLLPRVRPF